MIETTFGTQLRAYEVRISRERWEVRLERINGGFQDAF